MRLGSSQHDGIKKLKEKEYVAVYTAAPSVVKDLFFCDSKQTRNSRPVLMVLFSGISRVSAGTQ